MVIEIMNICNSQFSKLKVWNRTPILTLRNEKKRQGNYTSNRCEDNKPDIHTLFSVEKIISSSPCSSTLRKQRHYKERNKIIMNFASAKCYLSKCSKHDNGKRLQGRGNQGCFVPMHATKECTQFLKIFQNTPYSKNCPNTL
jgi:hypothetical protein